VRVLDLFAGIGGFTLGLERAGFETVAFCEIDPYAQKVLKKNWPGVPIYDDVRTITAERLASDGVGVDVITGGFPCQDISVSGNQAGIQDGTRSGLWSECARLLGELRPRYAIFENVTNLLNGERGAWFKRVLWDISQIGYDAEWHCIPASELGANHHRDRIWIVAYPNSTQCKRGSLSSRIYKENANIIGASGWQTEPSLGRVANGIPNQSHRLKCLGNAVVPPIPELIGRAINGHR
jgi:DNA (cytosine-5)-methyltransferase 1